MRDPDLDSDLQVAAHRVMRTAHETPIDLAHKAQLRDELLRRHQELSAGTTQRAAFKLWPRLSGLKRLTLVAPPAVAGAVALSVLLWGLQISGHQKPQTAEAAKITQALARTAPSVTHWQWTLQVTGGRQGPAVIRGQYMLTPNKRLDVQSGRVLMYSGGHWIPVTADTVHNPGRNDWNVAFAVLAVKLGQQHFSVLPNRLIARHLTEGIRYSTSEAGGATVITSFWVDPATGLVFHIDRLQMLHGKVVEHDSVQYDYGRAG